MPGCREPQPHERDFQRAKVDAAQPGPGKRREQAFGQDRNAENARLTAVALACHYPDFILRLGSLRFWCSSRFHPFSEKAMASEPFQFDELSIQSTADAGDAGYGCRGRSLTERLIRNSSLEASADCKEC